jgi:folate-binding protein YgfZ
MLARMEVSEVSASAAARDVTRALREPVLVPLPEFGVIAASGPDAISFLQTQLTNDVTTASAAGLQLTGYCTVKGRLLATFHQWRSDDSILLRLPREILPGVVKRLSMFVLRAKVKLVDASDAYTTHALLGPSADSVLSTAGLPVPAEPWSAVASDGLSIARMSAADGIEQRFLVSSSGALPPRLAGLTPASGATWWWSEIAAAVPTVFAATQEKFVPQMINFEVLGGVSFKKGCYPGQEIVARSQYLGKLKRRMNLAHTEAGAVVAADDIFHSDGAQAVGTVVMAAPSPDGGTDLLFEAPIDRLAGGSLHVGSTQGAPLAVRPLPYQLFDPTE